MAYRFNKMNLQESIRRILREEDYSPAGKEITPNNIVIHKSNPVWRENILKTGLQVSAGECYKTYVGYGVKCKPAIFATNSTNKRAWFDSTYDDDIWEINTEMIPDVKWYKDRHFESRSKHIVTFQDIPKEALTLKYEGTGSGDVEKWGKDSPNLYESIIRILKEETDIKPVLHNLLNMLFEGFDNIDYDWANYMCGMGECCDPYAIGFTLPNSDYDDYVFKLVDGDMYDDDSDYPKEFQDELPEPCYQQPDLKDPRFDTIVFYGLYAEEIENYFGSEDNWALDLLMLINNKFGCDAKRIIII